MLLLVNIIYTDREGKIVKECEFISSTVFAKQIWFMVKLVVSNGTEIFKNWIEVVSVLNESSVIDVAKGWTVIG